MATTSVSKEESSARLRMHAVLAEAETRFRHELLDEEERCLLHSRIVTLKKKLASLAS